MLVTCQNSVNISTMNIEKLLQSTRTKEILKISLFLLMFPLTSVIFHPLINCLGLKTGYWTGFLIYWALILSFSLYYYGFKGIAKLYSIKNKEKLIWILVAFIPVIPLFIISFLPSFPRLRPAFMLLTIAVSCINGFSEELFWRGLTLNTAFKKKWIVIVASLVGFGLWHFTLNFPDKMAYQGGVIMLVGSAVFMGILWQLTASRTKNILYVTLAHILVNIFAFSTMILENWQQQ